MLRIGLLSTLVLAVALGGAGVASGAALAAGPDFVLVASPQMVEVHAGTGSASTRVTVSPFGGFTGTVTFQVSGLPSGTSATVVPNSSGASIVFTASSSVPTSDTPVMVTGTSGSLTDTLFIQLQVVPPGVDFAIFADQSSVTVGAGSGTLVQDTIRTTTATGFSGIPTFTATGLPAGVTARFQDTTPVSGGFVSALLFSAASTAPRGTVPVTVTGFAASVASPPITISLTVTGPLVPDFSLSANPASTTLLQGSTGTIAISVAPSGGFTGSVGFGVSGLPNGVTASFSPTSSAAGTTLTLSAIQTATTGSSIATVTGTSGSLSHVVEIQITVTSAALPDFGLSVSPPSVSVQAGSSATATITATPTPGAGSGPGPVSLGVSGLPAGVTATFSPNPITTGLNSTMTITAAGTASAASATVTVTATGTNSAGPIVHTVNIGLTVTGGGGATGGVTATPVVSSSGPYFNEEDLKLADTASLTSLSITIVVQRTTGVSFSGQYDTVGGSITQSSTSTASTITYQFNLAAGSTLAPGTGWTFAAQTSGSGTAHPTAGDTFTVTYTAGGTSFTQTGHF
jgi:hypothetical protein